MLMLGTCFRFDTPVELKKRGQIDQLKEVLAKLYGKETIEERML